MKITPRIMDQALLATAEPALLIDICNRAIEIAQAEAEQFITAEQARALGAGAEYYQPESERWITCEHLERFPASFHDGEVIKYRAIKQPKPAEPTKETLHNVLKEGEVNERADFHALVKQAADMASSPNFKSFSGLYLHAVDGIWKEWTNDYCPPFQLGYAYAWRLAPQECKGKSIPTCQVQLISGEVQTMTREKAKALQSETRYTHDWGIVVEGVTEYLPPDSNESYDFNSSGCLYVYRPKAKKVISLDPEIREGVIALLKELCVLGGN